MPLELLLSGLTHSPLSLRTGHWPTRSRWPPLTFLKFHIPLVCKEARPYRTLGALKLNPDGRNLIGPAPVGFRCWSNHAALGGGDSPWSLAVTMWSCSF